MAYPSTPLKNRSKLVRGKYALISPEGRVINTIPGIKNCELSILASPKLGANFVQMVGVVGKGGETTLTYGKKENIECFLFVIDGAGSLSVTVDDSSVELLRGGYVYAPPGKGIDFKNTGDKPIRIILYKQKFVPHPDPNVELPFFVSGNIHDIEEADYEEMNNVLIRNLLPTNEAFDMNFHTLAFLPGGCHPFVETHVQEHGAYIYQGQGLYLLDEEWMNVQAEDFIWFAPFTMQACYGTGLDRMEYIYSKDCNRDEELGDSTAKF